MIGGLTPFRALGSVESNISPHGVEPASGGQQSVPSEGWARPAADALLTNQSHR